ncbi:MAG TPA: TolC family outer membrane protein [Burkholderiales bacterium]|nr:TolC family outer membrane protein [Burkholderiales bacterium]
MTVCCNSFTRLVLVALAAFVSHAADASDLVEAWQSAQQHDAAFRAAHAQWQAGQTKLRQSRALFRPQVALTGSASYLSSEQNTTGAQFAAPAFGTSTDVTFRTKIDGGQATAWALTAQQPIYSLEREASSRQLDRQAQVADAQFRSAQQELMLSAAQAYFAVVLAEETLATLRAQKNAAGRALEVAKEKFEAGATPVTDRDEAQARFDEIASQEILAQNDAEMKQVTFQDATGQPAARLNRIPAGAPFQPVASRPLPEWLEQAGQSNPLIAMQELGQAIARDEVLKFRGLTSPSLDLVARVADDRMHGPSGFGTTHITSSTRAVGVQLTIPLFTGGMRSAKRDEASALAAKAEFDAQALRQEVLRQTRSAWLAVSTGNTRVQAQEQVLRSAQSRLNATETGKDVGARTMLDFMNAQSDFYQAQRALLQTKYQLLLDRLRLSAAAGVLTETELREIDAVLTGS